MGLISYIKERYYNSKLNKADLLLKEGRTSEAEKIYKDILDKQPFAASRLTEYYYLIAQKSNIDKLLEFFKSAVNLEKAAGRVYNISEYDKSLAKFTALVVSKAETLFAGGSYYDCYRLLSIVNSSKNKTESTLNLCCEAKINQLYQSLKTTKITDAIYSKILNELSREWWRGKSIQCLTKVTQSFCANLESAKRFYVSNAVLTITEISGYQKECLDNALQIVSGNDIDASSAQLKETVSIYGKEIILRQEIDASESAIVLKKCWGVSNDSRIILDVLNSVGDKDRKQAFVNCIFDNHRLFLSDKALLEGYSQWLYSETDTATALNNLEKLNSFGYDVEMLYTEKLSLSLRNLSTDEQVNQLNHAQSLYPNSSKLIDLKLECAKCYESKKENDKAISVADSILRKCSAAYIVKANALCNKAENESRLEKKEKLLSDAEKAIKKISNPESRKVSERINDALVAVAKDHYSNNQIERAYDLLSKLGKKGVGEAIICIAKFKLIEVKSLDNPDARLQEINKAIDLINSFKYNPVLQCSDYQSLWSEKSAVLLESCKSKNNQHAVSILEQFVNDVEAIGFELSVNKLMTKLAIAEIIKRKYLIAKELELSNRLDEASKEYKSINNLEAKRSPTLSALRFILCKLKVGNNADIFDHKERIYTLLRNAAVAFKSEKEDIAFRFALVLLKSGEEKEALAILDEFLPSEEFLRKACLQGDMIKAQAKLEDFNNKLDAVKNKTLSSDDAIRFINSMLEYAEIIKPILSISRPTLTKYRNKLKNYAIFKLFDEEHYDIAFEKMLKEHSDYLEDFTALRNIALLCLNMAELKQISQSNYKDVISVWLTAVYQELLFVKSLDYTSWDDQYTFTLYEAYGHFNESTHDNLPDNVNLDEPDEGNNISIREVQRSLLDRFEAAISDNQVYHIFFSTQKDAMDDFIALNLDEKCKIVAPYLAKENNDVFEAISHALETDRVRGYDNWEDVLSIGAIYQMSQPIYKEYCSAKAHYEACMEVLDSFNTTRVNTVFQQSKLSSVKQFGKLYSAVVSCANSKASALSAQNKTDFKGKYNFYLIICNAIKDNTLSFVFSNFVMSFVVGEVNDKRMKLSEASDFILSAYLLDTTNTRVKDNLKTLFEMLIQETLSVSDAAANTILSKVKVCDSSFYNLLNDEYQAVKISKELNSIVENVNNKKMKLAVAADKILSLYVSDPTNLRIKDNLKILFGMLCHETSPDSITAVNNVLSKVKARDNSLYNLLNNEYTEAKISIELNSIVDRVNKQTLSEKDALSKIYTMYCSNTNNEGICRNLAQLAEICIVKYIIKSEYGSESVISILDKLKNNKSTEFRNQSSVFRKAYNDIWNQLPNETKLLLNNVFFVNNLNAQGLALKNGLEFMKELGGFTSGAYNPLFGGLHQF